jgi:hypothetical protein
VSVKAKGLNDFLVLLVSHKIQEKYFENKMPQHKIYVVLFTIRLLFCHNEGNRACEILIVS